MKKTLLILVSILTLQLSAQTLKETPLNTSIKEVTVFLQNAQITRAGMTSITKGKSIITLKSLSPYVDQKSIQVKGTGDFTVLSISHKLNYTENLKKDKSVDSLETAIEKIELTIERISSRNEVLSAKKSLLDKNKELGGQNSGLDIAQLKIALDLYEEELTQIKKEQLNIKRELKNLDEAKSKLEYQLNDVSSIRNVPTGQISIKVEADRYTTANLTVSYIVANAGWYPNYDIKVADVQSPLELFYKADVFQNTGVNWDNVKLNLSNGNPNLSGLAPTLNSWYLDYPRFQTYKTHPEKVVGQVSGIVTDERGEGIPGANVIAQGSSVGTITDLDGYYDLTLPNGAYNLVFSFAGYESQTIVAKSSVINIMLKPDLLALDEVVVVGYGSTLKNRVNGAISSINFGSGSKRKKEAPKKAKSIVTTTFENQTTVEFEVEKPYTIRSNSEKLTVSLTSHKIETLYNYFVSPKQDNDAFLKARIVNWDRFNLLEGEANLYFEGNYVGRSILDANIFSDTLDISLGRDQSIAINREKVIESSKKRSLGSNQIASRAFKTIIRNKKSLPIDITVVDQIPVSTNGEITVEAIKLSGGKVDEITGQVSWKLRLDPQKQKELNLMYEVKYPKKERLYLE